MTEEVAQSIVDYLNNIIKSLKPITYDEFNKKFQFKELANLDELNCILTSDGQLSHISLLISVIEFFTHEKIAFEIDDTTKVIKGVKRIFNGIN